MTALAVLWAVFVLAAARRWRPPPPRVAALCAPARAGHVRRGRGRWWRVAGAVAGAVVLAALWPPLVGLAAAAWLVPHRLARMHRVRRQRQAIARALPDVVDLLVVAIGAGLTPTLAVRHLATLSPAPFDAAFAEVDRRVARGQRLADALDALPERLGHQARPIAAVVGAAERYGTPLAPSLELLAHEARRERRRHAEETARTLPVKLCFPLVVCILPAFVLLTIAPLVAGAIRSLRV